MCVNVHSQSCSFSVVVEKGKAVPDIPQFGPPRLHLLHLFSALQPVLPFVSPPLIIPPLNGAYCALCFVDCGGADAALHQPSEFEIRRKNAAFADAVRAGKNPATRAARRERLANKSPLNSTALGVILFVVCGGGVSPSVSGRPCAALTDTPRSAVRARTSRVPLICTWYRWLVVSLASHLLHCTTCPTRPPSSDPPRPRRPSRPPRAREHRRGPRPPPTRAQSAATA
jgi:hypothetical protein